METKRSIITIGNFDGIHLGHKAVISKLIEFSKKYDLTSIVITYSNHPFSVLNNSNQLRLLTPQILKQKQIKALGVDIVDCMEFNHALAMLSAGEFLQRVLIMNYHPQIILAGYDSHFGYQRQGDFDFLKDHEQDYGYQAVYIEPQKINDIPISSTLIRTLIANKDINTANKLLGSNYTVYGKVISGTKIGRKLGYPTINLQLLDSHQLIPHCGVYLVHVKVHENKLFGLTNIGISPTMKTIGNVDIETYIFDFQDDIYGQEVEISFIEFIREERKYSNKDELIKAIQGDIDYAYQRIGKLNG